MTDPRKVRQKPPFAWVPTLYFAEGIPFFAISLIAGILYKRLGMGNDVIALYTKLLLLPWSLKPLWSPLLEMFKTKKYFVVLLQLVGGVSLAVIDCVCRWRLFSVHDRTFRRGSLLLLDPRYRRRRAVHRQPVAQRAGRVRRLAERLLQRGAPVLAGRPDYPGGLSGSAHWTCPTPGWRFSPPWG
jgi:hypothetical protein